MKERNSLTSQELADLLDMISKAIRKESSVTIREMEFFIKEASEKRGLSRQVPQYGKYHVERIISLFERFRTVESLRSFLQVPLDTPLPYRMNRESLINLGIGAFIRFDIPLQEAEQRWEEREEKLASINLYHIEEKRLITLLQDDFLFPDGYAIVSFAKRFQIKLPLVKDKRELIQQLLTYLYERPRSTKKIGYYGVDKGRKKADNHT